MTAARSAWLLGLAVLVAVGAWWLAQVVLSAGAGREIAVIADQGLRVLLLAQALALGLTTPWLLGQDRAGPALAALALLLLLPLPLHLMLALAAPVSAPAAALLLAALWLWLAACAAAALPWRLAPLRPFAAHGRALVQAGALVLGWRFGPALIDWAVLA